MQGTVGEVAVTFDKPLASGEIVLDDGSKIALSKGANNTFTAKVPIQKDGMYHVAAIEAGDDVRLSEDYFIEAMKDNPPEVTITRPGRDFRASPIEEVTVAVRSQGRFRAEERRAALLGQRQRRKDHVRCSRRKAPRNRTAAPSSRSKISRWSPAMW